MKTYPLSIQELREFEGGHLGYYSKGHHDAITFVDALFQDHEVLASPGFVRHEHWRCVPVGNGEEGTLIVQAKAGARGAFPVTVVEDA